MLFVVFRLLGLPPSGELLFARQEVDHDRNFGLSHKRFEVLIMNLFDICTKARPGLYGDLLLQVYKGMRHGRHTFPDLVISVLPHVPRRPRF